MRARFLNVTELEMKTMVIRGNVISWRGTGNVERLDGGRTTNEFQTSQENMVKIMPFGVNCSNSITANLVGRIPRCRGKYREKVKSTRNGTMFEI